MNATHWNFGSFELYMQCAYFSMVIDFEFKFANEFEMFYLAHVCVCSLSHLVYTYVQCMLSNHGICAAYFM